MTPVQKDLAEALGMYEHRDITVEQLIDQMLEHGVCLTAAEIVAPHLAPFVNDPRGLAQALIEDSPRIAEVVGLLRRH